MEKEQIAYLGTGWCKICSDFCIVYNKRKEKTMKVKIVNSKNIKDSLKAEDYFNENKTKEKNMTKKNTKTTKNTKSQTQEIEALSRVALDLDTQIKELEKQLKPLKEKIVSFAKENKAESDKSFEIGCVNVLFPDKIEINNKDLLNKVNLDQFVILVKPNLTAVRAVLSESELKQISKTLPDSPRVTFKR